MQQRHSSPGHSVTTGPPESNNFPKDYLSALKQSLSEQPEEYKELYSAGQENLQKLMGEYRDPTRWALAKVNKDTTLYIRSNAELYGIIGASSFKAETEIDCPPFVLQIYAKDFEKRKLWDEDTA